MSVSTRVPQARSIKKNMQRSITMSAALQMDVQYGNSWIIEDALQLDFDVLTQIHWSLGGQYTFGHRKQLRHFA